MKAYIYIKVEIDITPTEKDSGLTVKEIADYAAGGLCLAIKNETLRSPAIKSCSAEYTEKFSVDY